MIHYQLRCGQGHEFDSWYKDSAAFEELSRRGLLECPQCGDPSVSRALMAPALASGRRDVIPPPPRQSPATPARAPAGPAVGGKIPDQVRAMLQRLRAEVERNCDYVGPRFAEEALRIHHGEAEPRGIYGETTPDQAEALAEEGVRFSRIPWVGPAES
ncbi:MAG TPA: DUF1178 family protein [Acetobacteraceae bacterium]|nr:DUF1178 family protein [Acetobacteraceae bacterium]